VDASHPLFQTCRVPGHVIVNHQPTELQIDAFASGIGGDQIVGAAVVQRTPKKLDLCLAVPVVEAAMDQGNLSGESDPFQTAHQKLRCVAVLGEDDEFLPGEGRVAQHSAELLELRILAGIGKAPSLIEKCLDLCALFVEIHQR